MIVTFLERACTRTGHRFRALCSYVVHQDAWWLGHNPARAGASAEHCDLRERFESGMRGLPFPPAVETPEPLPPEVTPPPAPSPRRAPRRTKSV